MFTLSVRGDRGTPWCELVTVWDFRTKSPDHLPSLEIIDRKVVVSYYIATIWQHRKEGQVTISGKIVPVKYRLEEIEREFTTQR